MQCIVVNTRFLLAVFKQFAENGFLRDSHLRVTPNKRVVQCPSKFLLVKLKTLHPDCFPSDRLECEDYFCIFYPVHCPTNNNHACSDAAYVKELAVKPFRREDCDTFLAFFTAAVQNICSLRKLRDGDDEEKEN